MHSLLFSSRLRSTVFFLQFRFIFDCTCQSFHSISSFILSSLVQISFDSIQAHCFTWASLRFAHQTHHLTSTFGLDGYLLDLAIISFTDTTAITNLILHHHQHHHFWRFWSSGRLVKATRYVIVVSSSPSCS